MMKKTMSLDNSVRFLPRQAEMWVFTALLAVATVLLFRDGARLLADAWTLPEYSHGPLIPVISAILLHRQIALDDRPLAPRDGATVLATLIFGGIAAFMAAFGSLSGLYELSAYGIVVFAAAGLAILLGWPATARYWHPIVHLSFMLPLPGLAYYGVTTALQGFSSEAGVMFIRMFDIPVVLNGNVIDMGEVQLLVAEACSGLRYMFPILSFSYVLAILYRGSRAKKLLIFAMAVPTAIAVNALRIAAIGIAYGLYDIPPNEGIAHFLEGWVVFLISIGLIASCAVAVSPAGRPAFESDFGSPRAVAAKLGAAVSLPALRALALLATLAAIALALVPERGQSPVDRVPFSVMEEQVGDWTLGRRVAIDDATQLGLAADDVFAAEFSRPGAEADVELFTAYYADQRKGGIHSPEICLPGAGWEIEKLERVTVDTPSGPFPAMQALIRRDLEQRVVLYWFDQHGRKTAVDYTAKFLVLWDGVVHDRTDGALVRVVSPVLGNEDPARAEARVAEFAARLPEALGPHLPAVPGL